ncbi:GLPGLI family protein [Porphyromonas sp. COT-108 OH2963]|uniref:GLPGLI family protein n=1 Tax=Porphyromonas sp. COT-108 OH2963 TaxID=1515614 RepID=UPI00055F4D6E|nr:GLPGLI family protein [Porphyromonas sp. COT-108 OH2963]
MVERSPEKSYGTSLFIWKDNDMRAKQNLTFALLAALLFCMAGSAMAENNEVYRAVYKVQGSYMPKKAKNKSSYTEAVLEISSDKSFFFDRWFEVGDSIYQSSFDKDKDRTKAVLARQRSSVRPSLNIGVKNDFSSNSRETIHAVNVDLFHYTEELTRPAWEVVQDSTAVKSGYNCIMAKAQYLGREWIAWYTPDIPSPAGPWKLWGLPGLIVEAKDSEGLFSFALSSFSATTPEKLYGDFSKYKDAWENKHMGKKKQVLEAFAFFISDPVGYFRSIYPGAKVTVTDQNGNKLSQEDLLRDFVYLEK